MQNITIHYVKNGIHQYNTFKVDENGVLINPSFFVSYSKKTELPSTENVKTIRDALEYFKSIAGRGKAEIWSVDGVPKLIAYTHKSIRSEVSNSVKKLYIDYYNKQVLPILQKYNYSFDDLGLELFIDGKDLDSLTELNHALNFVCYEFLSTIGVVKYDSFKPESYHTWSYLPTFLGNIPEELLIPRGTQNVS